MKLVIGTRGSELALWQAEYLQNQLSSLYIESELKIIKTQGDRIQDLSFDKLEGKGFFTKEIEEQLLSGDIDLAVHSLKDMPTESHPELVLGAVSYREDPSDWLLMAKHVYDPSRSIGLPRNARVGTSSNRRKVQLKYFRPDALAVDIRGNVATRIKKIDEGTVDAVLLAGAGLTRLKTDLSRYHIVQFNPREFIPAPGQGILTYQTRMDRLDVRKILSQLHVPESGNCSNVERTVLKKMGGGCSMPLGVYCYMDEAKNYHAWAAYATDLNSELVFARASSVTHAGLADTIVQQLKR